MPLSSSGRRDSRFALVEGGRFLGGNEPTVLKFENTLTPSTCPFPVAARLIGTTGFVGDWWRTENYCFALIRTKALSVGSPFKGRDNA